MTDYLHRLAARALGLAPTARPYLLPRFVLDVEGRAAAVEGGKWKVEGRAAELEEQAVKVERQIAIPAATTVWTELHTVVEASEAGHPADSGPAAQAARPVEQHQVTADIRSTDGQASQRPDIVSPAPAAASNVIRPVAESVTRLPSRPLDEQPSFGRPSTLNLQPSTFNLQPSTFSLQPSIRVAIGRIDVRAVAGPQPPRKRQDAPPSRSLDDYLRERDGDRR